MSPQNIIITLTLLHMTRGLLHLINMSIMIVYWPHILQTTTNEHFCFNIYSLKEQRRDGTAMTIPTYSKFLCIISYTLYFVHLLPSMKL